MTTLLYPGHGRVLGVVVLPQGLWLTYTYVSSTDMTSLFSEGGLIDLSSGGEGGWVSSIKYSGSGRGKGVPDINPSVSCQHIKQQENMFGFYSFSVWRKI